MQHSNIDRLCATFFFLLGLTGPSWAQLEYLDTVFDGVSGVDGLDGAEVITMSPGGTHVYATGILDNALAVFSRDSSTGLLTFLEVHRDGVAGVDGIMGAQGVVVGLGGRFVFVAGSGEDAVAVFRRDDASGLLTFLDVYRDGVSGIDGLAGPLRLITIDRHLYVTGSVDNAIAAFEVEETGDLTLIAVYRDGEAGIDGLMGALGLAVTGNGDFVYASGTGDDALAVFSRAPATGELSFVDVVRNGVGGVTGLDDPQEISLGSGGRFLYCASFASGAVTMFRRMGNTGMLVFLDAYTDGSGDIDGLAGALGVIANPNGRQVAAMGFLDSAVAVFDRGGFDLYFAEAERDGVMGVDGLFNAVSGVWDPAGKYLYVTGFGDDAISIFRREETIGGLIVDWMDASSGGTTVLELVAFISASSP